MFINTRKDWERVKLEGKDKWDGAGCSLIDSKLLLEEGLQASPRNKVPDRWADAPLSERTSEASQRMLKPACQNEEAVSTTHSFLIILPFQEACFSPLYGVAWKALMYVEGIWPYWLTGIITCSCLSGVWTWITDWVTSLQQQQPTPQTQASLLQACFNQIQAFTKQIHLLKWTFKYRIYALATKEKGKTNKISPSIRCNYSPWGTTETNPSTDGPFLRGPEPARVWQSWADRAGRCSAQRELIIQHPNWSCSESARLWSSK